MYSVIIFQAIFVFDWQKEKPKQMRWRTRRNRRGKNNNLPISHPKTNHFHIDLSITLHMVDAVKCNYGNTQVFVVASVGIGEQWNIADS